MKENCVIDISPRNLTSRKSRVSSPKNYYSTSSSDNESRCSSPLPYKIPSPRIINTKITKLKANRPSALFRELSDLDNIKNKSLPITRRTYLCKNCFLIWKNLYLKLVDHLLLGGEHTQKICDGFNTPIMNDLDVSSEDKTNIVLEDPKFGMFSLFKYHIRKGYLNQELKKSNKVFCSHIFSLAFALPILIFISQWTLYAALMSYEIKRFDGDLCPNNDTTENKLMMFGIAIVYFVRSFFIWDNLTNRISFYKTNRADNLCAILDTFQEFMFTLVVYIANLWIIFVESDLQNMILNSLAMEFLMQLDNEFEEMYFKYLPGSAEDIYDTIYVTYQENKELIKDRQDKSACFKCTSICLFIPYKILIITLFLFPLFCLFVMIGGPFCK
jgi:hypothetical protein